MKTKQKFFAIVFAVVLLASIISGCAGEAGMEKPAESTKTSQEEKGTEAANSALDGEKPVLKFLGPALNFDVNEDVGAGIIQEITGYELEFTGLTQGEQSSQKLLLLLSSGEEFDVLKMAVDDYISVFANNALMPLNDLLDQYGPNILENVNSDMWKFTTKDGEKYGLVLEELRKNFISSGIIYRQDVFDENNIAIPSDIDGFYEMLKELKLKIPEAIPVTFWLGTEIGSSFSFSPVPLVPVASAFGIDNEWKEEDGELKYFIETEGFKDYLKFMHKLYQEKLIDQEFAANKEANSDEKFVSGKAMMKMSFPTDGKTVVKALRENYGITNDDIKWLPVLEDGDGTRTSPYFSGIDKVTAISVNSQNPEHAVNWINICMEPETNKRIWIGEEGTDHYVEDGEYYPILPRFFELRQNIWWYLPGYIDKVTSHQWLARVRKDPDMEFSYAAITDTAMGSGVVNPASNVPIFDSGEHISSLRTYVKDEMVKFIMNGNIDDGYDAFIANWKANGGDEWKSEVNGGK